MKKSILLLSNLICAAAFAQIGTTPFITPLSGSGSAVGTVTNLTGTNGIVVTAGDPIVISADGSLATTSYVASTTTGLLTNGPNMLVETNSTSLMGEEDMYHARFFWSVSDYNQLFSTKFGEFRNDSTNVYATIDGTGITATAATLGSATVTGTLTATNASLPGLTDHGLGSLTNVMRIDGTNTYFIFGNAGIGINTTPAANTALNVSGKIAASTTIEVPNGMTFAGWFGPGTSAYDLILRLRNPTNTIRFQDSNTNSLLTLNTNGAVFIGPVTVTNGIKYAPMTWNLTAVTNGMQVGDFKLVNSNGVALWSIQISAGPTVTMKQIAP